MVPIRMIGCLITAAAATTAIGCSKSSTAPNAAVAGSWAVTWSNLPGGTGISPTTDTLTIVQSGGSYTLTYGDIIYTVSPALYWVYDHLAAGTSFAVSGNNVAWHVGDATNTGCYLALTGTVSGSTMQGTATQSGGGTCATASWSWAATRM